MCLGTLLVTAYRSGRAPSVVMMSLGDSESRLDSDAAQIASIGDEINSDMTINSFLHSNQLAMGLKAKGHCSCDCNSDPSMSYKAKTATMLEQVGENVFLAREVVVERGAWNPGRLGEIIDPGGVEPVVGKHRCSEIDPIRQPLR